MKYISTIFLLIFFSIALSNTTGSPFCSPSNYRLSGNVKPTFYTFKIQPQLEEETFIGEAFIHIHVEFATELIEFHLNSTYLDVHSITFDTKKVYFLQTRCFCNLNPGDFGYEISDFELIRIVRGGKRLIPPGTHVIHIKYSGKFSKTKNGIFKTGCSKNGTILTHLIATDFQPTYARQVFPCFDEPRFKAKYQLNVVVSDDSYKALSNMRVQETVEISNGIIYKFEPTPIMSIYLLTFAVTQHSYIELNDWGRIYRLYAYNISSYNTSLLEYSNKVIQFYAHYTQFNYNLPKTDFIGYDREETAATENWGLVTFNTSLIAQDDAFYDDFQRKAVIAHELAHFWFGNLVTNDWWDDIWLHESFATFMGIKAEEFILGNHASNLFPTVYMENLFWFERAKLSTPIISFHEDPVMIRKNFNDITYIKGACVLRMLENAIGDRALRKIIVEYIQKYAFKTATTSDFCNIVENITEDVKVREFMESYLYQDRFPIIHADEVNDEYYVLRQESYGVESQDGTGSSFGYKWTIPITYITNLKGNSTTIWFHKEVDNLILPKENTTWIKFNCKEIGYYRVHYSDKLWGNLEEHLEELPTSERDQLLLDALGVFHLNITSCDSVLKLLWEMSNSTDFNLEYAYTVYINLRQSIKKYDDEATHQLNTFFGHVLERAKVHQLAKRFLKDSPQNLGRIKKGTKQMEKCIEWLKTESYNFYSNSNPQKNNTLYYN